MIFRNWVLENFPFLEDDFDALTDYELFCKMMEYVKQFAKDNEDFNKRLTDLENYINNLDLQDEVNNKLDEMAESGQLADIIAQYLQLAGVLAYDTVNDLKNATNIVNGSICKTLGFYIYNDGGGAYYKIRTIINTDVTNNYDLFSITNDNTLVAELIPTYKMSVKQYGAYGDGIHDDTSCLQYCIENKLFGTIYFDNGEYLISSSLKTYVDNIKQTNIIMEKTTVIKSNTNIDCLFELGGLGGNNEGVINRLRIISGGILDANNCNYGIKIDYRAMGIIIKDMEIKNFANAGIYAPTGETLYSSDLSIINCYINGKGSYLNNVGIYLERPDNKFENLRINACKKCIYATMGGQFIHNVHGLGIGGADNWFDNTVFFEMAGGTDNVISDSYCDTLQTFVKDSSNDFDAMFTLTNSTYYSYDSNVNTKLFIINKANANYIIKNNTFMLPNTNGAHQGIIYEHFDQQYTLKSNQVFIEDNMLGNSIQLVKGDLLLTTHKRYKPYWTHNERTIPTDKWIKIGYIIPNMYSWYDLIISLDGYELNPQFKLERFGTSTYLTYRGGFKDSNVSIKLGVKYENNTNGIDVYGLYIQGITTGINENIEVKQLNDNVPYIQMSITLFDPELETTTMDAETTL